MGYDKYNKIIGRQSGGSCGAQTQSMFFYKQVAPMEHSSVFLSKIILYNILQKR